MFVQPQKHEGIAAPVGVDPLHTSVFVSVRLQNRGLATNV